MQCTSSVCVCVIVCVIMRSETIPHGPTSSSQAANHPLLHFQRRGTVAELYIKSFTMYAVLCLSRSALLVCFIAKLSPFFFLPTFFITFFLKGEQKKRSFLSENVK